MARLYCRIAGVILLILGVLGLLQFQIPGVLTFNEPGEIALHLILGALSCFAGFSGGTYGGFATTYAKVFGIVYLALGALGFIYADILPGLIHLDTGCNFVHLVLGLWGIWAGFFAYVEVVEPHPIAYAGA